MSWEVIRQLPEDLVSDPLFAGGSLAILFENRTLTFSKLRLWEEQRRLCGDLTEGEKVLLSKVQKFLKEWEESWEF